MNTLPAAMQVSLAALVLVAAGFDVRERRIPNWLVAIGFIAGLSMSIAFFSIQGLRSSCLGAALAFAVYFPLFALRAMGGGDLKLMVAVATFTGPSNWIVLFAITALLGGVIAVILVLYRRQLGKTLANVLFVLGELLHFRAPYRTNPEVDVAHPRAARLPHGVSIAGGTLLYMAFDHFRQ